MPPKKAVPTKGSREMSDEISSSSSDDSSSEEEMTSDDETEETYRERVRREGEASSPPKVAAKKPAARRASAPALKTRRKSAGVAPPTEVLAEAAPLNVSKRAVKTAVGAVDPKKVAKLPTEAVKDIALDERLAYLARLAPGGNVKDLEGLVYPNGEKLLNTTTPAWMVEVAGLIRALGWGPALSYLQKGVKAGVRPFDLFTGSTLFETQQNVFRARVINLTRKIEVQKGLYTCAKCGSKNTTFVPRQLRSADEGMTDVVTCQACSHQWRE